MKHENGQNYVKTLVGKIHTASERISTNFTLKYYLSGFVWENQLKLHNNHSKEIDIDKLFVQYQKEEKNILFLFSQRRRGIKMNSIYQIVQIDGKGFGCVALKDIKVHVF